MATCFLSDTHNECTIHFEQQPDLTQLLSEVHAVAKEEINRGRIEFVFLVFVSCGLFSHSVDI